jgi:tRNA-2-methylthio-N6-dimethylallyladenosine synthase
LTTLHSKGPELRVLDQDSQAKLSRRKVFVKSYGCQMNAYDATRMIDVLAPEGFEETQDMSEADLVVLNTCHIRERSAEKVYSELGKVKLLKQERARSGLATTVAVAGCGAQAEGAEIIRRQASVDIVVGPQNYHRLPELLQKSRDHSVIDTDFPVEDKFNHLTPPATTKTMSRGVTSFLTVQEGCDKFCTFCVVPYTRGAETSRPVRQIVNEAQNLVAAGVREITLLGQNVNAYHGLDEAGAICSLAELVGKLSEIRDLSRIRYMTSHPRDMNDDLIQAHVDNHKLMPFLHLPVQSGSDRILKAMNRKHDARFYIDLVSRIRQLRSDIALSSDFIVGFPGETEADFQATLDLISEVNFSSSYFFKYSVRSGTPGAEMDDQVPEAVKSERLARLQYLVDAQRYAFNEGSVGKVMDVLLEKRGRHSGQIVGKTPYLQTVQVDGAEDAIGQVRRVCITGTSTNTLFGSLTDRSFGQE